VKAADSTLPRKTSKENIRGKHPAGSAPPGAPSAEGAPVDSGSRSPDRSGIELLSDCSYYKSIVDAIHKLPKSFGEDIASSKAKSMDPYPYNSTRNPDGTYIMYVPEEIPHGENADAILDATAYFISIANAAGMELRSTKREVSPSLWKSLVTLLDGIKGAYFCLSRDEIAPVQSIPTPYKQGFGFALWYAYASAAKDSTTGTAPYLTIDRKTSLSSGNLAAWSSKENAADLLRISQAIRQAAQLCARKVGSLNKFCRPKGWFLSEYGGKKPISGLFTDLELSSVSDYWESKQSAIASRYDVRITATPVQVACSSHLKGIQDILASFVQTRPTEIKQIEDCVGKRIPDLLVTSGRGKKTSTGVAKGGSLPEKLVNAGGGKSIRTVGNVLWSPLYVGYRRDRFTELSMLEARHSHLHLRGATPAEVELQRLEGLGDPDNVYEFAHQVMPGLRTASSVYLELIPDMQGTATWDAAFAAPR
jgi:hypothetical protein